MMFPSKSSLVLCSVLSLVFILLKENRGTAIANKLPAMNVLRRIGRNITADTLESINWDSHHQQQSPQHKQNCMTRYPPIRNGEVHVYFVLPRLQMLTTKCPPPERLTTEEDITTPKHTTDTTITPITQATTNSKTLTTTASKTTATTPTIKTPITSKFIAFIVFPLLPILKTCRPKFIRLGDKCYHFSDKKEMWLHAYSSCPLIGGEFAHPDQTENQRVKYHLRNLNGRENWWFGGNDRVTEGDYRWAHNFSSISFFDWDKRPMPDKESYKRECMLMKKKDFTWDVENCFYRFRYICEHSLNVSVVNVP